MDPQYLSKLIDPIIEGVADYTKGNRLLSPFFRKKMPIFRIFGNSILSFFTKISSGYWHIMDTQNGYTAISKKALSLIELDNIYPYYGYCNDILVGLNVFKIKIKDIEIPAVYEEEKSKIKLPTYMVKLSYLLTKKFFWRLKEKYIKRDFHPLVLFYMFGFIIAPLGFALGLIVFYYRIIDNAISIPTVILTTLLLITGIQFILFAMLFDMEENRIEQRL